MIGAVDIGGTKIAAGIVDENGRVRARMQSPTDAAGGYANGIRRIAEMLRETAKEAGVKISGIGIGSTGVVYPATGEFGDVDFLPGWKGFCPVKDLEKEFGVGAAIENDGDAAALGEAGWGAGKGKSRLIYVTVGTGIGGGIILDGQLYRGAKGAHPEIGHHVVDWSGPPCTCGFRGCWEVMATGPAMAEWYRNHSAERKSEANHSAREICHLAREGDADALKAIEHEAHYLGLGIANLISLFVPDMIVLGGSVMKSADLLLGGIRNVIASGCRFVPAEETELALASLGEDANLIGAARVWHHRFA